MKKVGGSGGSGATEIVDFHDVRVHELAHHPRFFHEPYEHRLVREQIRMDAFDGNGAIEGALPRLVDATHATFPEESPDLVTVGEHASEQRVRFPDRRAVLL